VRGLARRVRRAHFVGIGGSGMSGLAELLHARGVVVTGSDLRDGPACRRLRGRGIDVRVGHAAEALGGADVCVHSAAVPADNPELAEAGRRGIPMATRAEMLAELLRDRDAVAVAGTHGKTTTSALVAHVLADAGLDPLAVVGGRTLRPDAATGARAGEGDWAVAEADESDGSFVLLSPAVAVVTNVEAEHLDHYGSLEHVLDAFAAFLNRLPFWGAAVLCADDPGVQALRPRLRRRAVLYGLEAPARWRAEEIEPRPPGSRFRALCDGRALARIDLPLPGRHNVANALAALAVAEEAGVPFDAAAAALEGFPGVERRFQRLGSAAGVEVVDDYAHHPSELRATLASARSLHPGRLVAVFQPHRYTRTRAHFDDFAAAFDAADRVVLTEVYAAGEEKLPGAEGALLADAVRAHGHPDVLFVADLEAVPDALLPGLAPGDQVLTLGAGSVTGLGPILLERLRSRGGADAREAP